MRIVAGSPAGEMITAAVPEGWRLAPWSGSCWELSAGRVGAVTIDYTTRSFRPGLSIRPSLDRETRYGGRGWRARLLEDAIAHLRELEARDA